MRDVVLELLPGRLADEFETGIFHRDAPAESVSSRAEESASSRADMSAEISSSSRADMSSAHVQCGDDWLTVPLGGRADAGGGGAGGGGRALRGATSEPAAGRARRADDEKSMPQEARTEVGERGGYGGGDTEAVGKEAAGTSFMLHQTRSLRPHTLMA